MVHQTDLNFMHALTFILFVRGLQNCKQVFFFCKFLCLDYLLKNTILNDYGFDYVLQKKLVFSGNAQNAPRTIF